MTDNDATEVYGFVRVPFPEPEDVVRDFVDSVPESPAISTANLAGKNVAPGLSAPYRIPPASTFRDHDETRQPRHGVNDPPAVRRRPGMYLLLVSAFLTLLFFGVELALKNAHGVKAPEVRDVVTWLTVASATVFLVRTVFMLRRR